MFSRLSLSVRLVVSRFLKIEMISLTNVVSYLLFGGINNLEVLMNSLTIGMVMMRGAWSENRRQSG